MEWSETSNETGYRICEWNGANYYLTHTIGANTTSFTDTGLSYDSDYFYELSAYNAAGESAHASWVSEASSACSTLPTAPSNYNPAIGAVLERNNDTVLSYSTKGTTCSVHVLGDGIDINPSGGCSSLHLGEQRGGNYSWQVTATNASGSSSGPVWNYKVNFINQPTSQTQLPQPIK